MNPGYKKSLMNILSVACKLLFIITQSQGIVLVNISESFGYNIFNIKSHIYFFTEMRSRLQSDIPSLTTHAMTPIPRPESGRQCHRMRADKDVPQNFVAMEQLVVRLRREIANMKNQITRVNNNNAELQKELNAATLKVTHLTGKLSELESRIVNVINVIIVTYRVIALCDMQVN